MQISDQFLNREEAMSKRDDYRKQADDWIGKMIGSVAAGSGVGLVALTTYIATKSPTKVSLILVCAATIVFLSALAMAWAAMQMKFRGASVRSLFYEIMSNGFDFKTRFKPHVSEEDARVFEMGFHQQMNSGSNFADDADAVSSKIFTCSVLAMVLGIVLSFSMILADHI